MPLIRRWKDIEDQGGDSWLTPAERQLIEACKKGEECVLGNCELPKKGDATREIRADVLRYLIVGGCEKCPVADWGVSVIGAYVSGTLDLSFASAKGITGLVVCRLQNSIEMLQTSFELLNLSGSHLIELNAQSARIAGDVFLRNSIATATIDLNSADIGGQLSCSGARLNATEGYALNAQHAQITGGLFWHNVHQPSRPVSFVAAHINLLGDSVDSWEIGAGYVLDGFTYNRIYGSADAHARIAWLEKGNYWGDNFAP